MKKIIFKEDNADSRGTGNVTMALNKSTTKFEVLGANDRMHEIVDTKRLLRKMKYYLESVIRSDGKSRESINENFSDETFKISITDGEIAITGGSIDRVTFPITLETIIEIVSS